MALCLDCEGTHAEIARLFTMLELLKIRGNFFFTGQTARQFPSLVVEIAHAGHQIESHTDTHPNLRRLSPADQRREILAGRQTIEDITGKASLGFRAPMHLLNRSTVAILREAGFRFDVSCLYFSYNMRPVVSFRPTWFREWMPLYDALRLPPRAGYAPMLAAASCARLPILPVHPQYAGHLPRLIDGYRAMLETLMERGWKPQLFDAILALPALELAGLTGHVWVAEQHAGKPATADALDRPG